MQITDEMINRMQSAVEGECDGLAIEPHHAKAILEYVIEAALAAAPAGAVKPEGWQLLMRNGDWTKVLYPEKDATEAVASKTNYIDGMRPVYTSSPVAQATDGWRLEVDDGTLVARYGSISITVAAQTMTIYDSASGQPAKSVEIKHGMEFPWFDLPAAPTPKAEGGQ
jgi:hypothetical protein